MKKIKNMSIAELAAFVCSHLMKNDVRCVLTGGACVSIYTKNKYESFDLDFIDNSFTRRKEISRILKEIGFTERNRYFENPETEYIIEFPSGPLSIGSQPVNQINEMVLSTGKLLIISPTDSVKDRLASYFFWNDNQALEQALMINIEQNIDLKEVENWAISENMDDKFKIIKNKFS